MNASQRSRLDPAPGVVAISDAELPPLGDDLLTNPLGARVDPRAWFANPADPLEIEIGSGKGTFLVQQAQLSPKTSYLGIEWSSEYATIAADRIRRHGLTNVRVLCADAVAFLRWRVPDQTARVIHLYFSDPWPKKKHYKNRVVRDEFFAHAWRTLKGGQEAVGEIRIVTDHDDYWTWMEDLFQQWTTPRGWDRLAQMGIEYQADRQGQGPFERREFTAPASASAGELVGTNFERKFRLEGRSFHACVLSRLG